ncbi:hypothetical protein F5B22DRAFT_531690 [Xylaria bambusicola]|uniref:uncharacterized protein n=1 Tax=Xylaria bambusicola TaxID=326684 RepID=UPI0020072F64|nr:uncharacterized protein F5B22DRAFT_531690 [Xylaria bambusicola]KAI0505271.1 hypothetical protein F5B22DRAFT_531690 [Xylaria bambusicola]
MPHIGIAMERSLQDGGSWGHAFANLVSRSAVAALGRRQSIEGISNDISDAATAFSSWDNCFQASICKWPVIALFIVGGLIILSIVWCIIRCCCCGLSCCCECCYCLKCCGECCGMCDPPRGKRSKYLDEPFVPPNHDQVYRSHAPMQTGFDTAKPSAPQYAEFDTGNKKDADALPAMPSWEDANSKKVLIEEDYVEMEPLKKPEAAPSPSQINVANAPSSTSPRAVSPYGPPAGTGGTNAYMGTGRNEPGAYGMNQQGYNEYNNQGYDQQYPSNGMNNAAMGAASGPMGRRTPHQDYNAGYDRNMNQNYNQYPQSRSPRPYQDEYRHNATQNPYNHAEYRGMASNDGFGNDRRSPAPQAGYGYGNPRMGSPGAQPGYGYANARASPAPQAAYNPPQRSRTHDDYTQQYPASSRQQYSNDPYDNYGHAEQDQYVQPPLPASPTSPIRNNAGFDFNSGYSRPDSRGSPAPQQSANGGTAYPGYRNYKPAQDF